MRGTSASCLQKNAWCVVRMTDQWVLLSPNVLTGYGPSWPVKKEANTVEVHRDALAETCKQCWNRVDFFVNILDSQTDMSRLKPQSTVYLKWPGNWGEYPPMFRQPTKFCSKMSPILHLEKPLLQPPCLSHNLSPIRAPSAVPRALLRDLTFP